MDCIDFRQTTRNPISQALSSKAAVGPDRNARELWVGGCMRKVGIVSRNDHSHPHPGRRGFRRNVQCESVSGNNPVRT